MSAQVTAAVQTPEPEFSLQPTLRFIFVNTSPSNSREVANDSNAMINFIRAVSDVPGVQKGYASLAAHPFVSPDRLPSMGPRTDLGPALPVREITTVNPIAIDDVIQLVSRKFGSAVRVETPRDIIQAGLLTVRDELPTVLVDLQAVARVQAEDRRLADIAASAPARAAAIEAGKQERIARMAAAGERARAAYVGTPAEASEATAATTPAPAA